MQAWVLGMKNVTVTNQCILKEGEQLIITSSKTTIAQQLAEKAQTKDMWPWNQIVPTHYHWYECMFSNTATQWFPPTRPWDHAINLKPDASASLNCKIYPLTPKEDITQQKFLDENLKLKQIEPSKSPYASLFFLILKKDGTFRPVQDYCKLNQHTIWDTSLLPLIRELMNHLTWVPRQCLALFMKLDIWWGYNNIQIKEQDWWKAMFKTNRGLFQPLVMFFGLTNTPATFQTMMNTIFCPLINEGYVMVYMDDILIHTSKDYTLHWRVVNEVLHILE